MTARRLNGTDAKSTPLRPRTYGDPAKSTPLRPRAYGDPADAYYHKLFIKPLIFVRLLCDGHKK